MPVSEKPRKPMNPIPIEDRGPLKHPPQSRAARLADAVKTAEASPAARNARRWRQVGRGAAVGAAVGAGYAIGRHAERNHQKEKTVTASKSLINPFEEVVVFGKAYPVVEPVPRSTTIRALVPTGSHVGHGNALKHVRNSKGGGGRATRLERYTGGHADQRVGPFGKSVAAGLKMTGNYRPTSLPGPLKTAQRVKAGRGTLAARQDTIRQNALPGQLRGLSKGFNFGSAGSRGKKLAAAKAEHHKAWMAGAGKSSLSEADNTRAANAARTYKQSPKAGEYRRPFMGSGREAW